MKEEVLGMEHVTYTEDGQLLLEQFHMRIFRGEIMGIVCDDNRGKGALTKILQLNPPLQHGRIYFHGKLVNAGGYRLDKPNRIAVIRQKPSLIENMTVEENIFVIKGSYRKILVNRSKLEKQFERFAKEKSLGLDLQGQKLVCELSSYERAAVELCKALIIGTRLVVICNMANYLGPIDLMTYLDLLGMFARQGYTFLYICDTFDEAGQVCSRIALMDHGCIRKIMENDELQERLYFRNPLMIRSERAGMQKEALLEFRKVSWQSIRDMSFCIYPGEWVTLLDMSNTVLEHLVSLMNMETDASVYSGNILFQGKELRKLPPGGIPGCGISFISENPTKTMLFQEVSYMDNLCFAMEQKMGAWTIKPRIRKSVRREYDGILGDEMDEVDITGLGRAQLYRLVYYRVHLCNPKIVFCVKPLAEEDIHMKREVKKLLGELHRKGIAIVELLSNISDLHTPADRTIIVRNGTASNR